MSKKTKFGDLKRGDRFIFFPIDGDNEGHGGFLGNFVTFIKIDPCMSKNVYNIFKDSTSDLSNQSGVWDNAVSLDRGVFSHMPDGMDVIQVTD